jgi:hypothetical protein
MFLEARTGSLRSRCAVARRVSFRQYRLVEFSVLGLLIARTGDELAGCKEMRSMARISPRPIAEYALVSRSALAVLVPSVRGWCW